MSTDAPVLLDEDGYPTEESLNFLRTFTDTPRELVEHLTEVMCSYGCVMVDCITDDFDRPIHRVYMATGGWSGCEEVVSLLERSFFWFAYWQTSRRGGGYTFHVPESRWDEPMIEWPPAHQTGARVTAPRTVAQWDEPCVLHATHSPITVINEKHHIFPQAWQKALWGEVRDQRTVSLCATGHNTVTYAIDEYQRDGRWPDWCVGKTRDLCERAFELRAEAEGK